MKFEFCMVYVTTKDSEEARKIGSYIVEKRLAACANIVDNMSSLYHWKSRIEEDKESIVIFKTRLDLYQELEIEIKKIHSYEVPCIVAYPIIEANDEYLNWLKKETKHS